MQQPVTTKTACGTLLSGVLAGALIGVGGTVFLSLENRVLGACFFSIGLFFVVSMRLWLFTGKVGWLCQNRAPYALRLLLTLAGNFLGTLCVALPLRQTRAAAALVSRADALCAAKLADSLPSLFILAAFCGVLMYLGVSGFQHFDSPLGRYGAVFLAVTVFILSGFEHCIADMFYYGMAGVWGSGRAWLTMLVMVLGNGAGSVAAAELYRLSQRMME